MITNRDTIDETYCVDCRTDTLHEFTFEDDGRGRAKTGKCLSCGKVVKFLKAKKHKDNSADVSGVPKKRKKK